MSNPPFTNISPTLEFAPLPDDSDEWAQAMRKNVYTVNVEERPLLASYLPLMANKSFMLRWAGGSENPMDASFNESVEVVIFGLEKRAAMPRED